MQFEFQNNIYSTKFWTPEDGLIGELFAFDTETDVIVEGNGQIPAFILGQAYAGNNTVYLIKDCSLSDFLNMHQGCIFVMQNAPFDVSVIEKEIGFDFDSMIRQECLFDTGIMYRLYELATRGAVPHKWSLSEIAKIYLGIDLDKEESVRCSFNHFITNGIIDYEQIPETHIQYAATDAIVTYLIFSILNEKIQSLNAKNFLSHKIQLMGGLALNKVSLNGIGFDLSKKLQLQKELQCKIDENIKILSTYGFLPGKKGIIKDYEKIISDLRVELPTTSRGALSRKTEDLEKYKGKFPFIDAYIDYQNNTKMMSFLENLNKERIHTHFTTLLNTGRTSSSSPNLQNIPRDSGLRECFIPAPGFNFIIIDYSQLELCVLAQICFDKYGYSKMKDLINQGVDLHRWFASIITDKPESEVTDMERKQAKACNFGFPGGLGIINFLKFAKTTYGLNDISDENARELKTIWLDNFPEMKLYLRDHLLEKHDFTSLEFSHYSEEYGYTDENMAFNIFKRILGGEAFSKQNGSPYSEYIIEWAFKTVLPDIAPQYAGISQGSPEIKNEILKETVEIKTGRIRANCSYTEARNTRFQGLAADGAKIALYRLIKNGYKVVNFIHDEFLIEVSQSSNIHEEGEKIKDIVIKGMKTVIPDVRINAELKISDCWGEPTSNFINNNSGSLENVNNSTENNNNTQFQQRSRRPRRVLTNDSGESKLANHKEPFFKQKVVKLK